MSPGHGTPLGMVMVFGVSTLIVGCGHDSTAVECAPSPPETSAMFDTYGDATIDGRSRDGTPAWRAVVDSIVAVAPPDSVMTFAFGELAVPREEFIRSLESVGAEITYIFRTIDWVSVRIPISGIEVIAKPPAPFASIGIGRPDTDVILTETCTP